MRNIIGNEPSEYTEKRKKGGIGHLEPEIVLTSSEGQITLRQLEVLKAISQERSQNRAAARLNISAAVLNRQLKELERKAKSRLVKTTKRGSELTLEGRQMLRILDAMCKRMVRSSELTIGCTPVSQAIVERVCTKLAQKKIKARLVISDDEANISMSSAGLIDIIFLDDPQFAYDFPKENRVHEVTKDFLIHFERGKIYARLNSGPQRIGFDLLRQEKKEFEIRFNAFSPEDLIGSKLSFFVSKILLTNRRLEIPQSARTSRIPYGIYAVETTDHANIRDFFECMAPQQYYPIG